MPWWNRNRTERPLAAALIMIPLIVSCEHATCAIPDAYRDALKHDIEHITSPLGWDLGALNLAQAFSMKFRTPLTHADFSRLIIDCHLALDQPNRWSELSFKLSETQRDRCQERYSRPYLDSLRQRIQISLERAPRVFHLSVHTFDPDQFPEAGDFSLLFDRDRITESTMSQAWHDCLTQQAPDLRITSNHPFYPDNTVTVLDQLRAAWRPDQYFACEIQVSNRPFLEGKPLSWEKFKQLLMQTFQSALSGPLPLL